MTDQQQADPWMVASSRADGMGWDVRYVAAQAVPAKVPAPDVDVLAHLNVPASAEDWHALCDAWGVPRHPDALVRAVQAATWDRATTAYIADARAREDA